MPAHQTEQSLISLPPHGRAALSTTNGGTALFAGHLARVPLAIQYPKRPSPRIQCRTSLPPECVAHGQGMGHAVSGRLFCPPKIDVNEALIGNPPSPLIAQIPPHKNTRRGHSSAQNKLRSRQTGSLREQCAHMEKRGTNAFPGMAGLILHNNTPQRRERGHGGRLCPHHKGDITLLHGTPSIPCFFCRGFGPEKTGRTDIPR